MHPPPPRRRPRAWGEYEFQNPVSKQVEQEISCCEKVQDVVVCCGAYEKK